MKPHSELRGLGLQSNFFGGDTVQGRTSRTPLRGLRVSQMSSDHSWRNTAVSFSWRITSLQGPSWLDPMWVASPVFSAASGLPPIFIAFTILFWNSLFGVYWSALAAIIKRHRLVTLADGEATWIFSSYGGILELRRGIQDASCVGPGKSNLPLELRRKAGHCSRVTAGPIDLI